MDISIIVPVYNVEKYLDRCLESLLEQEKVETEILIIDDGSTDNSGKISDIYQKKYNNIYVYHKKNEGLGLTRNYGMDRARGDYILFVDSDDYIKKNIIIWFVSSPSGIGGEIEYYSRLFSNTIFLIITGFFIYRAYRIFGIRCLDLLWISMILSYSFLGIFRGIIKCGIMNIIRSVFFFQDLVNVNNYLEVHDLTFALGFFLIFFLVFGKKCNISNLNLKIVISFIYIFLGYKRIELLAILVVALFYYLFDRYSKTTSRKYIVPGIIAILICFLFIAIIYDHRLNTIAMQYNINFNHRLDTWQYWANKTKFSIGFWGLGIGYVDKETFLLHGKNGLINNGLIVLSGMHSDLFKKYVEIGMIPFLIWLIYILIFKTKILYKKQGFLVAEIYLLLTIYAIILYLTDNIYSYFLCNCCYILIPMAIYDKQNNMVMQ